MNKKVVHVITGLGDGGAENMLYKVLKNSSFDGELVVISLTGKGKYYELLKEIDVNILIPDFSSIRSMFQFFRETKKLLKEAYCVQSWLYHADLFAFIMGKIAKTRRIGWNIRHGNLDKRYNKKRTLFIVKINAFLSKYVDFIVCCSQQAIGVHEDFGYQSGKIEFIPNGFEVEKFDQNLIVKKEMRKKYGLNDETKLVVHVGRWNVQKDHENLIKAISQLENLSDVLFVMIGKNIDRKNAELTNLIEKNGVTDYILLLGQQSKISDFFCMSDFFVSSSRGEGFPNVLGEAMLCQLPCCVTDAGDSRFILADDEYVVPIENAKALSNVLKLLIHKEPSVREAIGRKNRERIVENFDIVKVAKQYTDLYD